MTITTAEIQRLCGILRTGPEQPYRYLAADHTAADMLDALATELIAVRAKLKAAEKLEVAARKYRRFVMDHNMTNEVVPLDTEIGHELSAALAAWEAAQ